MKKKSEFVRPRIRVTAKIDVEDVLDFAYNEDMFDFETSFEKTENGYYIVSTKSLDIHDMRNICEEMFTTSDWWEAVEDALYHINEESMTFHIDGDECVLEFTADLNDDAFPPLREIVSLIHHGLLVIGGWTIELIED